VPSDGHVLVDARHPAWQAFARVEGDVPADAVPWPAFAAALPARLAALTGRDHAALVDQVLALLRDHPGTPIGVTFDGGIAITVGDYRAAERRHADRRPPRCRP
jgi:hypothetical protein